jgi:hypothetical protein
VWRGAQRSTWNGHGVNEKVKVHVKVNVNAKVNEL